MSISLKNVRRTTIFDAPVGSLVLSNDIWLLRVLADSKAGPTEAALVLTGPGVGALRLASYEECLVIEHWEAAVESLGDFVPLTKSAGSLVIGSKGVQVWGSFGPSRERCFHLSGKDNTNAAPDWSGPGFSSWQAWATDEHGRRLGAEPLFTAGPG